MKDIDGTEVDFSDILEYAKADNEVAVGMKVQMLAPSPAGDDRFTGIVLENHNYWKKGQVFKNEESAWWRLSKKGFRLGDQVKLIQDGLYRAEDITEDFNGGFVGLTGTVIQLHHLYQGRTRSCLIKKDSGGNYAFPIEWFEKVGEPNTVKDYGDLVVVLHDECNPRERHTFRHHFMKGLVGTGGTIYESHAGPQYIFGVKWLRTTDLQQLAHSRIVKWFQWYPKD